MDIWRGIVNFPKYVVNPEGVIRNKRKEEPKSTRTNNRGDLIVDLSRDDRPHTRKVSLLVAQTYLGEPENEAFNSVIHLDGDKLNCSVGNLAWRPRWFVVEYNRMFSEPPYNVSVMNEETGEIFGTLREACIKYGLVEQRAYINARNGDRTFPANFRLKIIE